MIPQRCHNESEAGGRDSEMLILKRKSGETIQFGNDVRITVGAVKGNRVRLKVTAAEHVPVIHNRLVMGDLPIDEEQVQRERDWSQVIPV